MTFAEWLAAVDNILLAAIGLSYRDLGDGPWADYFADELSPAEALDAFAADWDDTGLLADLL
jgi:hypothetical protein